MENCYNRSIISIFIPDCVSSVTCSKADIRSIDVNEIFIYSSYIIYVPGNSNHSHKNVELRFSAEAINKGVTIM